MQYFPNPFIYVFKGIRTQYIQISQVERCNSKDWKNNWKWYVVCEDKCDARTSQRKNPISLNVNQNHIYSNKSKWMYYKLT